MHILEEHLAEGRFEWEKQDCVVQAICNASGLKYRDVHAWLKARGRKNAHTTFAQRILGHQSTFVLGFLFTRHNGHLWPDIPKIGTVRKFAKEHRRGRYLLTIAKHALCIVDGTIIDSDVARPRARITAAWKVEKITD